MEEPTPGIATEEPTLAQQDARRDPLFAIGALIIVLAIGAYFRFTGLYWGDYQYQHPDERFLVWVVADIQPVTNVAAYFDTATSTLNPANRGHAFYVYGDFPVILTRYVTNWIYETVGWEEIVKTGRALSAISDLLTVLLVFLAAERLMGWRAAFIAGLFCAGAVLQIQQAHFFTTDAISTTFTMLAVYLAVLIATSRRILWLSLAFGAAVGLAMACKINTFPVAALIPAALAINALRRWRLEGESWRAWAWPFAVAAVLSGVIAFAVFRVAQPYAFSGPSVANVLPDPAWVKSMQDQRAQASGDVDFPPALQWARRSHLFSLQNMVIWGLGIPLGVLAWAMFLYFAYQIARRIIWRPSATGQHPPVRWYDDFLSDPWPGLLLILAWTGAYFLWQSTAWNPTMRYQLPIYPTLAVIAGVGIEYLLLHPLPRFRSEGLWRAAVGVVGGLAVLLTLAWALAFVQIYHRTETRVAASRWIFNNVPGPITLHGVNDFTQLVSINNQAIVRPGRPYDVAFDNVQAGALSALNLTNLRISAPGTTLLQARIIDPAHPDQPLAETRQLLSANGSLDKLDVLFNTLPRLEGAVQGDVASSAATAQDAKGHRYTLSLDIVNPDGTPADSNDVVAILGSMQLSLYGKAATVPYVGGQTGLTPLTLEQGGALRQIRLPEGTTVPMVTVLLLDPLTNMEQSAVAQPANPATPNVLQLNSPIIIKPGLRYQIGLVPAGGSYSAANPFQLDFLDNPLVQYLPEPILTARSDDSVYSIFAPQQPATLEKLTLAHAAQEDPAVGASTLSVTLTRSDAPDAPLGKAQADLPPSSAVSNDPRGGLLTFTFDKPVPVDKGINYTLTFTPSAGQAAIRGSAVANESDWDMGLPFRMDNYDPFGGIYRNDLNFQMYWDDNADKYQRFVNTLDQTDYIFFSSNRQWGTTTRVPERYPLTTEFYRDLLGCPPDREVLWCYNVAAPGMFQGELGFDLVETFTSYPTLGPIQINTQFAEEAFTVYDAPKVFIFKKRADYTAAKVESLLGAVDLSQAVHITPRKASGFKEGLLPVNLLAIQQTGGTWAGLFPPEGLQNRYPWLGAVLWYLLIFVMGLFAYPLIRMALPGLPDRGYPLSRIVGMVLLGYFAWIAGSLHVPVTRLTVGVVFALLCLAGAVVAFLQRGELRREWSTQKGYFLRVELAALALFAIDLLIRLGNPDLWHPIFGGEKPMDFSFFNAVLKSTVFPPYDPWFAGGSLNYYYYGYVLVGMPLKLIGITPSVAYNLILPTLFSMVGLAALSIGWNLFVCGKSINEQSISEKALRDQASSTTEENEVEVYASASDPINRSLIDRSPVHYSPNAIFTVALISTLFLLLLGNLGTVRMFWQGFQKMVVSDQEMQQGTFIQHWEWAAQGFGRWASGQVQSWPYYPGDWYWKPSRAIEPEAGGEITEFPFFTFLYADLHAHMMALPVTLLVIGWALGLVLGKGRWGIILTPPGPSPLRREGGHDSSQPTRPEVEGEEERRRWGWLSLGLALLIGALATGALRPANTWDQYTYLTFAAAAVIYNQWRSGARLGWLRGIGMALVLVVLAVLLYQPFDQWFAQAYNSLEPWNQDHTNLNSYLVHWGLFLFVIASWLFSETVDWMAKTPLSALNGLRKYQYWLIAGLVILLLAWFALVYKGVEIALIVVPLGVWVTILLFRPEQPDAKRFVLFMIGTALLLTLAVELVAVKGDIGRMNTVFKFYFQAWSMFALSAAAGLGWLWERVKGWAPGWREGWLVALALLVFGAVLYPLTAAKAKIEDRMVANAPHVLDGMAYMDYAHYTDGPDNGPSRDMDLSQDYRAIRWIQRNVPGSPVIVEANTPEYRHWGTRFTIYTGLPGVVGWNWHERQQRALTPDTWVYDRIDAIQSFYETTSPTDAEAFLKQYNVQYIIVGQLERIFYDSPGLGKFPEQNGKLWNLVYQEGDTAIYRVK